MIHDAVILAAGKGTRLGDDAKTKPKGFLSINGTSLIQRSLDLLKQSGIERIFIVTGHESLWYEQLMARQRGFQCILNKEFNVTGTLESLCSIENNIHEDFILLESDLVFERRCLDILIQERRTDVVLASDFSGSRDEMYVEADEDFRLRKFTQHHKETPMVLGHWVGMSRVSIETFHDLCDWAQDIGRPTVLRYEDGLAEMAKSRPVFVNKVPGLIWGDVDTLQCLDHVRESILPRIKESEASSSQTKP